MGNQRVRAQRLELVARTTAPDYALGTDALPLVLVFSGDGGGGLPTCYAGGAILAEHSGWKRPGFSGCKVVCAPVENGRPSGRAQYVVTGFLTGCGASRSHLLA